MTDVATTDAQVAPTDASGQSGGSSANDIGALSFLNADWVNTRIMHVKAQVEAILDRIIDRGLMSDGYLPFQSPITDNMLVRMSPDQLRMLFDTQPSLEAKANLLARLKALKLPTPIMLPPVKPATYNPHELQLDLEGRLPVGLQGMSTSG
ncbi:MAG: hypothetical protein KGI00_04965 [Candidatus Micrarchaeota archaeon]|nr:hypothetical protein [Candidatus Micrarchaeota archaeon]